jgi:hypothetical protein
VPPCEWPGDVRRGGSEGGVDVLASLGEACAGEIERDDVLPGELLHERDEGLGTTHQAVQKHERGCVLCRCSLFQVGETKAVELEVPAFGHAGSSVEPIVIHMKQWAADQQIPCGNDRKKCKD